MYVQPIFILVNVSDKQITTSENITLRRREFVVSEDGNLFYRAVAFRKDEIGGEKHEEIPWSSDGLFENNPKVLELPLLSSNRNCGYTISCASLLKRPICTYSSSQKKRFSFESIINAGSFSLITSEKQCRCLIS